MLTGKQRSYLRGLANGLDPKVYIGKDGLTPNVVKTIDQYLTANEIIKGSIQEGAGLDAKEVCNEIAFKLNAQFVQAIGRKFVLYRESQDEEKKKIVLP